MEFWVRILIRRRRQSRATACEGSKGVRSRPAPPGKQEPLEPKAPVLPDRARHIQATTRSKAAGQGSSKEPTSVPLPTSSSAHSGSDACDEPVVRCQDDKVTYQDPGHCSQWTSIGWILLSPGNH